MIGGEGERGGVRYDNTPLLASPTAPLPPQREQLRGWINKMRCHWYLAAPPSHDPTCTVPELQGGLQTGARRARQSARRPILVVRCATNTRHDMRRKAPPHTRHRLLLDATARARSNVPGHISSSGCLVSSRSRLVAHTTTHTPDNTHASREAWRRRVHTKAATRVSLSSLREGVREGTGVGREETRPWRARWGPSWQTKLATGLLWRLGRKEINTRPRWPQQFPIQLFFSPLHLLTPSPTQPTNKQQ
jgi:hypothetical protein